MVVRGVDYVRGVFEEVVQEYQPSQPYRQGAFLTAALEVMRELESPLKEETLVRLAVLELQDEQEQLLAYRQCG